MRGRKIGSKERRDGKEKEVNVLEEKTRGKKIESGVVVTVGKRRQGKDKGKTKL